ncbi:MAG: dehydrogenase [Herbaspirillum sp.]|jgi:hypothetical protein|nr:dehydrogenase [Herbaspirillum sp.]
MRFMILAKADKNSEAGVRPDPQWLARMDRYNKELVNAGVLLAAERLHSSAGGARVRFAGGRTTVVDGPFGNAERSGELLAGFWLIQAQSRAEAIEWVKRCPMGDGAELEIRQACDAED